MGKLENATANVDPDAFEAAFTFHPPRERDFTGHWLWTMFIENRTIKYRLQVKYMRFRLPENYLEKRQRLLTLLLENGLVGSDSKAGGKHTLQAVIENDVPSLQLLLEHNFPLNVADGRGDTPLSWAVREGFFTCARIILNSGQAWPLLGYVQDYHPGSGRNLRQLLEDAPRLAGEAENRRFVDRYLMDYAEGFEETKNSTDSEVE